MAKIKKIKKSLVLDYSSVTDPEVVDKQAYLIWKRCHNHRYLNEDKIQALSNGGKVNLGLFPTRFKNAISKLPKEEQEDLLEKKKVFTKMLTMGNGYKLKAYGHSLQHLYIRDGVDKGKGKNMLYNKKSELIELFGRMFSIEEVHKIITEQWRIPCSRLAVQRFREDYIDQITERIDNFRREYSDIRLGIKRGRLEELVYLFMTMKAEYEADRSVVKHRALIGNLEQIRKEVEGDTLRIEGNLELNIEANVNQHLQYEVFKAININQIIIGRVAAKLASHPEMVVKALLDSYYSKLTGIVQPAEEDSYDGVEFPSMIPYDFTKIQQKQQMIEDGTRALKEKLTKEEESYRKQGEGLSLKEKLLGMAADQRDHLKGRMDEMDKTISGHERRKQRRKDNVPYAEEVD